MILKTQQTLYFKKTEWNLYMCICQESYVTGVGTFGRRIHEESDAVLDHLGLVSERTCPFLAFLECSFSSANGFFNRHSNYLLNAIHSKSCMIF